MKVRNLIILVVLIVLIAALVYVALSGVPLGVYEIRPLPEQIDRGAGLDRGRICSLSGKRSRNRRF